MRGSPWKPIALKAQRQSKAAPGKTGILGQNRVSNNSLNADKYPKQEIVWALLLRAVVAEHFCKAQLRCMARGVANFCDHKEHVSPEEGLYMA